MREESQLDEWLLLKSAPYTDWHVDIDKPETSVVVLSENETGEALVHAQPMRVPEPLRPLLFHLIERLQAHVSAGDPIPLRSIWVRCAFAVSGCGPRVTPYAEPSSGSNRWKHSDWARGPNNCCWIRSFVQAA